MNKKLTLAAILATSLFTIQVNAGIAESTRILMAQQTEPQVYNSTMLHKDFDGDSDDKHLVSGRDSDVYLINIQKAGKGTNNTKVYADTPYDMDALVLQGSAKVTYVSNKDGLSASKSFNKGDLLYFPKGNTYTVTNTNTAKSFKAIVFHAGKASSNSSTKKVIPLTTK